MRLKKHILVLELDFYKEIRIEKKVHLNQVYADSRTQEASHQLCMDSSYFV